MNLINWRKSFHLNRSRQIAGALLTHGWRFLRNNEEDMAAPTSRALANTRPAHLRLALEELGTTFIQLGQILSTRADLLPPEYLVELARLQDSTSPVPFEAIQQTLAAEPGLVPGSFKIRANSKTRPSPNAIRPAPIRKTGRAGSWNRRTIHLAAKTIRSTSKGFQQLGHSFTHEWND
jgi:hypothetical protein